MTHARTNRRSFSLQLATLGLALPSLGAACASTPAAPPSGPPKPLFFGITAIDGTDMTPPPVVGRITVVDFWASWCGPCRQSFPYLDQLYRTYKARGLDMLAVCVDDELSDGRRFWASMRPHFPVAWDKAGHVRERLKVSSLPTTFLFDADGMIVQRNEGFDLVDHRLLEEQVHRLLA